MFIVLIVPLCHDFDDLEVTVGKLVRLDSYDCIRQRHHYDIYSRLVNDDNMCLHMGDGVVFLLSYGM